MMQSNPKLDLRPNDWLEVERILKDVVPEFEVWAFGSRVSGNAKPYSDLDLTIMTNEPLSLTRFASIKEAFDESDLSIRVDLVDWAATTPEFQRIILRHKVVVQSVERGII